MQWDAEREENEERVTPTDTPFVDSQPFTINGPGFGTELGQCHIVKQKRLWKIIHCNSDASERAEAYVDLEKIPNGLEKLRPGGN